MDMFFLATGDADGQPQCSYKGGDPGFVRVPYDRALSDLVGELSTRSEPFRKWWAAHNVRYHQTGRTRLHHPTVGDLELDYEVQAAGEAPNT
jgi:MmyB-like transcription regulator ligand binding domain